MEFIFYLQILRMTQSYAVVHVRNPHGFGLNVVVCLDFQTGCWGYFFGLAGVLSFSGGEVVSLGSRGNLLLDRLGRCLLMPGGTGLA